MKSEYYLRIDPKQTSETTSEKTTAKIVSWDHLANYCDLSKVENMQVHEKVKYDILGAAVTVVRLS
jgi:hypothetical protein